MSTGNNQKLISWCSVVVLSESNSDLFACARGVVDLGTLSLLLVQYLECCSAPTLTNSSDTTPLLQLKRVLHSKLSKTLWKVKMVVTVIIRLNAILPPQSNGCSVRLLKLSVTILIVMILRRLTVRWPVPAVAMRTLMKMRYFVLLN